MDVSVKLEHDPLIPSVLMAHDKDPSRSRYYSKRQCYKFVKNIKNENDIRCVGCKKLLESHKEQSSEIEWNSDTCTNKAVTDAYGTLKFSGAYNKTASYIRIEHKTDPKDFIQYMYSSSGWGLPMPNLIISVTGGAQKFALPFRMKKAFKEGLYKAAASTGAWIVTGGTNTGVMKLVGEAISEGTQKQDIVLLGIATWGVLSLKEKMIENCGSEFDCTDDNKQKQEKKFVKSSLDPNHTHFVLVDDGSEESYGREISFRADLEKELRGGRTLKDYRRQKSASRRASSRVSLAENIDQKLTESENKNNEVIPMVLIVVNGGDGTLKTVYESVKNNVPVLVLAGSKGCADLIVKACDITNPTTEIYKQLIKECDVKVQDVNIAIERLGYIYNASGKLVNVFKLDSADGDQDIELAILLTFLNSRKNEYYENLKFALKWNRCDIAKTSILTGEEKFNAIELDDLMKQAFIDNKPDFIELLLENGVIIENFLTNSRLFSLYNTNKVRKSIPKPPLFEILKDKQKSDTVVKFKDIDDLMKKLDVYLPEKYFPEELENEDAESRVYFECDDQLSTVSNADLESVAMPRENLFLWAILTNRIEIAKIVWKITNNQIYQALFAAKVLKSLGKYLPDSEEKLTNSADEFEKLAIGLLGLFEKYYDNDICNVLLKRRVDTNGVNCLEMAMDADCTDFIAHGTVQNVLNNIWCSKTKQKSSFKTHFEFSLSICSFGFLAPFFVFDKQEEFNDEKSMHTLVEKLKQLNSRKAKRIKEEKKKPFVSFKSCCSNETSDETDAENDLYKMRSVSRNQEDERQKDTFFLEYKRRWFSFLETPKVRFIYDVLSYVAFVLIFSYMLLCDFKFVKLNKKELKVNLSITETTQQHSNETSVETVPADTGNIQTGSILSWSEIVIIIWVVAIIMEELRQLLFSKLEKFNVKDAWLLVSEYLKDEWNYIDLAGIILFIIGMFLRFISMHTDENLFTLSKITLCLDLIFWYLRLLHISLAFRGIGPKLVMIQKMFLDLIFFLFIIMVFIIAFGVTMHASMYQQESLSFVLVRKIFDAGYWPINGELKILEDIERQSCDKDDSECVMPNASGSAFSYFALIIYVIISNILLLNLLIAMFSYTFDAVQSNTNKIWKVQRYDLVKEYSISPLFPCPFNIIEAIYKLILKLISRKTAEKTLIEDRLPSEYVKNLRECEKRLGEEHLRAVYNSNKEKSETMLKFNLEKLDSLEQKLNVILDLSTKESFKVDKAMNLIIEKLNLKENLT